MSGSADLQRYLEAGIHSALSTPLVSRSGSLLGMVSVYWRDRHDLSESELGTLDVLARMAGDCIERSLADERLRESEARLKNAERLARVGNFQWDLQTNRMSGSEEMYRIFGKPLDFVPTYAGFLDDVMQPDKQRVQDLFTDSLARNVGHSAEYRIVLAGGEVRTILCTWEVRLDEDGTPVRIFGTCQDITDTRRVQQESFTRQKLETLGTLASGIAHDFNNLLGGVLAQAELGLSECVSGASPQQELEGIRDVALRGSEIVRQLMIYAGTETASSGQVDVSRIVQEMLELLKFSISKRVVLETDLAPELPTITANGAQIRQIVMNLVTNASDAIGGRAGWIRVTTRFITAGPDMPGDVVVGQRYVRLEVEDNGCGMTPDIQARAFDPFFTTRSAGHGLGLAVVDGTVRQLGGTILVTSEENKGTRFEVFLPCDGSPADATSNLIPLTQAKARPSEEGAILIVEDEDSLRQGIGKMLRKAGYEVFEAAEGPAAIDRLRSDVPIDLILLDMTIPGASSQSLLAEAMKLRPEMRVVLTSAYSEERVGSGSPGTPPHAFIRKPFQFEELMKVLGDALSEKPSRFRS
jgi:signal transduction histidine kinase/CheY-like chemotaxis protein